ncbi:MAG: gluconate 2-dehydrogenase subunit 3 family protein [Bacteroidota bacterium]
MNRREALQRAAMVLGYAVATPTLVGVLNGCKATPELAFKPVFFSEDQARLVAEVAEIIIPKTDTPGAKDVGVPGFIDLMLKDCYKKEDQDRYLAGLAEFDNAAKTAYGEAFLDLDPAQQAEHVKKVHDAAIEATRSGELKERPFILTTKELTVTGFFTSEPGATQVLQYAPVPGAYHGCLPLAEVGKTWAT